MYKSMKSIRNSNSADGSSENKQHTLLNEINICQTRGFSDTVQWLFDTNEQRN